MKRRKTIFVFVCLTVFLLVSLLAALSMGAARISMKESLGILLKRFGRESQDFFAENKHAYIIWEIRLPRTLLAMFVGASLSLAGMVYQGILQNPLADPHIMGVSSGAALGATVAILSGASVTMFGLGRIGFMALLFALLTVGLVFLIAGKSREHMITLLLVGTAIGTMLSAVVSLLMSFHKDNMEKIYLWTMGSFSAATWEKVLIMTVILLICLAIILALARELNLLSMGEEQAYVLGVNVKRNRAILLVVSALLVAVAVSVSGIIGFVGLIVPHLMRTLVGNYHGRLSAACALFGAGFMAVCDTLARSLLRPSEIPVGVLTAIIGGIYFVILMKRKNHKREAGIIRRSKKAILPEEGEKH